MTESHKDSAPAGRHLTSSERVLERGMTFTRVFDADVKSVFAAWTQPEVFERWWVPKSMGAVLESCEMEVRADGKYRLAFQGVAMVFHGTYLEVVPQARLVWTNEESGEAGAITTVTFDAADGGTLVVLQELYPSEAAFAAAGGGEGAAEMMSETFDQLEDWLARN